jgi:hypothetical protein
MTGQILLELLTRGSASSQLASTQRGNPQIVTLLAKWLANATGIAAETTKADCRPWHYYRKGTLRVPKAFQ